MNGVTRGIRNAFRTTVRTGSIVVILALSIGLIIAMLAARQAVNDKIATVKSTSGNTITVTPAGNNGGFDGGGNPLTESEVAKITATAHVTQAIATLSDRLTTDDTSLRSPIEPGSLGRRNAGTSGIGFEGGTPPGDSSGSSRSITRTFTMPVTVIGTTDQSSIVRQGSSGTTLTWNSGKMFGSTETGNVAVVGSDLATKNNLSVGSTFTAYDTPITVVGIYDAGNTFTNAQVFLPLSVLQKLSDQSGDVTSVAVTIDSSDNLTSTTTAIKQALGDNAQVTNSAEVAEATTKPLQSVATVALFSLIGALVAGALIILLTMLMIVRERRREIGVMKAIGAPDLSIMWQFIVESLTLTVLGLIVGVIIGIAAAAPLTTALVESSASSTTTTMRRGPGDGFGGIRQFGQASASAAKNIQTAVGISTLAYGIGATILIAILGSAIPSLMISKIKPADAMRSE